MNTEVKQLPISTKDSDVPEMDFAHRLWSILSPNSRMKRWTYAGIIMANLGDLWSIFPVISIPMLVISAVYYTYCAGSWLKGRLLWKVRNRILASFVFVGIVPLCLALLISVTIGWFLIGAMGTNLTKRHFQSTTDQLSHLSQDVELALYQADKEAGLPFVEAINKVVQTNQELQGLAVGIFERDGVGARRLYAWPPNRIADKLPEWAARSDYAGAVRDSTDRGIINEFRAVSDIDVDGRQLFVLTSVPIDQIYQNRVWEDAGVLLTSSPFLFDQRSPKTAWTPLPWGLGEFKLPWGTMYSWIDWEQNEPQGDLITGMMDPARIIADTMSMEADVVQIVSAALVGLCTVLAGVEFVSFLIGLIISRRITSAVHSLSRATQAIRSGRLDYRIETQRNDQLDELSRSFNDMAGSIEVLLNQVRDKHRIEAELEMAREVQARFLPGSPPENGRLELAATWHPARMVSGDYYDFIVHDNRVIDIVVADISGKGMSAALMMAGLQSALRSHSMIGENDLAPGRVSRLVDRLNQHLCLNSAPDKFATMFICSYDIHTSLMTYTCAGHNPPYLYRDDTRRELTVGGCPIGMFTEWEYEEETIAIEPKDLLVIYTDGITEAQNTHQEEFGEERLGAEIENSRELACEEIQDRILAAVRDFSHGAEQFDDQTVVVGRAM